MDLAPGIEAFPGLRLIRCLGEGVSSSVWLAEQQGRAEPVAVKFLSASGTRRPQLAERFRREAEAAAKMKNLHVVQVHDHGETPDGRAYMVMEYLEGETLEEKLGREGHVSFDFTVNLVPQLASALQAAHDAGLIHRNIKLANLFVVGSSEHPMLKVLDFGVAKDLRVRDGSLVTSTGVAIGDPFTMSPEQVLGSRHVNFRSDLWSFAAVVYRLVCGRMPFLAANPGALAFAICNAEYTPASELGAPPGLDNWFTHAFQPNKERRFRSARDMAENFVLALGEELSAKDPFEDTTFDGESLSEPPPTLPDESASWPDDDDEPTIARMSPVHVEDEDDFSDTVIRDSAELGRVEVPRVEEDAVHSGYPPPAQPSVVIDGSHTRAPRAAGWSVAVTVVVLVAGAIAGVAWSMSRSEESVAISTTTASVAPERPKPEPRSVEAPEPESEPEPEPEPDVVAAQATATDETAAGAATGKLSIVCVPACSDVRVDGSSFGPSPVFEREIEAGEHQVVLYQDGARVKQLPVQVGADQSTIERILLDRPVASRAASPTASPAPTATSSAAAEPAPSASAEPEPSAPAEPAPSAPAEPASGAPAEPD